MDERIFEILLSRYLPEIHQHLTSAGIPISMISFPWFLTLFMNMFPLDVSRLVCFCLYKKICARVLDAFFFEGREVLFKVGLAYFKLKERSILIEKDGNKIMQMMRQNEPVNYEKLFKVENLRRN